MGFVFTSKQRIVAHLNGSPQQIAAPWSALDLNAVLQLSDLPCYTVFNTASVMPWWMEMTEKPLVFLTQH